MYRHVGQCSGHSGLVGKRQGDMFTFALILYGVIGVVTTCLWHEWLAYSAKMKLLREECLRTGHNFGEAFPSQGETSSELRQVQVPTTQERETVSGDERTT